MTEAEIDYINKKDTDDGYMIVISPTAAEQYLGLFTPKIGRQRALDALKDSAWYISRYIPAVHSPIEGRTSK